MNSTIALGYGSSIKLAGGSPFGCTDVIICDDNATGSWTNGVPVWSLPVGGSTLLDQFVARVARTWNPSVTICGSDSTQESKTASQSPEANTRMRSVRSSRGSAGCLKDLSGSFSGGTIMVVDGAVWLDDDLSWMLRQHRAARNALTVFCASRPLTLRGDALSNVEPVSIFCCEPEVADFIAVSGTQDIAAHLIPALQRAGQRVGVATLRGDTREVCDWQSYLDVVGRSIRRNDPALYESFVETAPGVWCHKEAVVAPGARIVGPALIDRGCRVESGAVIVGPTILGPGCAVEACTRVVRTVAPNAVRFPIRPVISDRLVTVDPSVDAEASALSDGRATSVDQAGDMLALTGASPRAAVWLCLLLLTSAIVMALSGKAANVLQAWAQNGFLSAG